MLVYPELDFEGLMPRNAGNAMLVYPCIRVLTSPLGLI